MLHDIEKLKAAHEKSLAEAIKANAIALSLPITPIRVSFADTTLPWATYEVGTLPEALDIFKMYEPAPWVIAKNGGCTVFNTWSQIEEKYNVDHPAKTNYRPYEVEHSIEDGAPYFDCQQGVGFGGTEMEFFTTHNGEALKVIIKIAQCPIRVHLIPIDPYSRTASSKYRKDYPHVPGAQITKWGYGDDCAKGTYWFGDLTQFWSAMGTYVPDYATP